MKKFPIQKTNKPLSETHPHLLEIWDFEKNTEVSPYKITFGSHKRVWWKCPDDSTHSYDLSINAKTNHKNNCPQCVGQRVSDKNRLSLLYPEIIANEWDYELNIIKPEDISFSSHKEIWLKCQNNIHDSYLTSPNARITNKRRCPLCNPNLPKPELITLIDDKFNDGGETHSRYWIPWAIRSKKSIGKGKEWTLSDIECAKLILSPCFYCERYFHKHMGLDRFNNDIGYVSGNCVPCCKFCNTAKNIFDLEIFKQWIIDTHNTKLQQPRINIASKEINSKYSTIKQRKNFQLTKEEFIKILSYTCYYCGSDEYIGLDRKNSAIGYTVKNCVACCKFCNWGKLDQTIEEFQDMISRLYHNINNFNPNRIRDILDNWRRYDRDPPTIII